MPCCDAEEHSRVSFTVMEKQNDPNATFQGA